MYLRSVPCSYSKLAHVLSTYRCWACASASFCSNRALFDGYLLSLVIAYIWPSLPAAAACEFSRGQHAVCFSNELVPTLLFDSDSVTVDKNTPLLKRFWPIGTFLAHAFFRVRAYRGKKVKLPSVINLTLLCLTFFMSQCFLGLRLALIFETRREALALAFIFAEVRKLPISSGAC